MIPMQLKLVKLHEYPDLIDECVRVLNEEWPRDLNIRLRSLKKSSDKFPMCLALIDDAEQQQPKRVIGFVKLTSEKPFNPIVFVESLVIDRQHRRKGYGRFIMNQVEQLAKENDFHKIHLTTVDQKEFYCKIGYDYCHRKANNCNDKILMYKNLFN